jgi:HPt (histidine-containing phosphotransfer) domain-containing protein
MSSEIKVLDQEVIELLHDAIGDSLPEIINLFLDDVPESLEKMRISLAQGDFAAIGLTAHSLKSSSANLGAMQMSALCAELEQVIANGESNSLFISESIEEIANSFDQVRPLFGKDI